jgi:hypothetical protein
MPTGLQMALLGTGFGGLHIVFGYLTRKAAHDSEG